MSYQSTFMEDISALVSGVEHKVRKLIGQSRLLKEDINKKTIEIQDLKKAINEQKQINRQLEEKIRILKIAKALEVKEGNVDAKLKINELVREIDKCIGLLNT
jgi:uncharacterized protein YoxC